jgi:plasmid stabilization system protein ParE
VETAKGYVVEITPQAERFFLELLDYIFSTHHPDSASRKADEILALAISLKHTPYRGTLEPRLELLGKGHRFLLYEITRGKEVKIIYFVDEDSHKVFVTDFFGTRKDAEKLSLRTK